MLEGHLVKGHKLRADHLEPLVRGVGELLAIFRTSTLTRVPREENSRADELANQGIDNEGSSQPYT